ncbi:MAG: ThuA domain-containing protein, partial [bacterium]|nr:ThuA domain-containing protein [bacterium]
RAFGGKGFDVADEVFQFMDGIFTREKFHVLLSIDTSKTDVGPDRRILPERRKDLDFPISWVKRYGNGRVFYTTLGHNPHIWWTAPLLEHFLDGMQFALGDLQADTTPSVRTPKN